MHGMNYIGRFFHNFKEFYNDINGATLTGAIDVVVVEQQDGTYNCSPFHVRFGKLGVLRSKEKIVDIEINGEPQDIHMKLGESGEAFFVEEVQNLENEEIPEHLATSPIPISHFEELYNAQGRRRNSINLGDVEKPVFNNLENQVNDYKKRRYTADNDDDKKREHEFLKRQIGLGNIDIGEQSTEDLTLSIHSTKIPSDDISRDEISETIFRMDSLELDSKSEPLHKDEEVKTPQEPAKAIPKIDSSNNELTKSGKKKRRKKSLMKKKNSQRKTTNVTDTPNEDLSEPIQESPPNDSKPGDSVTDRSSLDSTNSETDLKDLQKSDVEITPTVNNGRKVPLDPDFHFFSDTELTTGQQDSRPSTPIHIESVQSDTEFEVQKSKEDGKEDQRQSWAWGEFPVTVSTNSSSAENSGGHASEQEQHNSMLSSMFSFMKQNKHRRRTSSSDGGMYLADLSSGSMDPDVAALYFTGSKQKKSADADMDCESGNGPSLTQSPNSAEGSKSIDSDFDDYKTILQDISLSTCGWEPEPNEEIFRKHIVPFSDLCNNPTLLESPTLVVRLQNKYYSWKVAAPIISSLVVYQRLLPQTTIDQLCSLHMPQPKSQEKESKQEARSYWWSWRRSRTSRETTPAHESVQVESAKEAHLKDGTTSVSIEDVSCAAKVVEIEALEEGYHGSHSSESDHGKDGIEDKILSSDNATSEKCRKTLRLSSEQITRLNLRDGMNEVEFSVTTAYQGTTRCNCFLYKWKWDDKIVISDIDGTITKSDVLGHILPIVGRDWAQSGVAQLFNKIKDNGYKLLYLSARAIGQARITRDYLKSIRQGDLSMPDGPLLLNPTSLITAFHREVIEKKPEQFKISCLSDIRALFPCESNPFYAGYGNRINDVWAYRAVGIPIVRIFTINPKGELKHELTQTFQSSYSNMSYIVDHLFPPLLEAANDYSQFVYWREPVPVVEDIKEIE